MRKCSLICLLLFCVLAGKAQVKKQVLMNVYAANAGLAALDGDEALRKAQLVTSNGATIEYDLAKKEIRLRIHLPEKHDLFYKRTAMGTPSTSVPGPLSKVRLRL